MKLNYYFFLLILSQFSELLVAGYEQKPITNKAKLGIVLPSNPSSICREQGFKFYADSLSDEALAEHLFKEVEEKQKILNKLIKLCREHAKTGGPIPSSIRTFQVELMLARQELDKIDAVQRYRYNKKLYDARVLSSEQSQIFIEQEKAYEKAKYLQLALSSIPFDLQFVPLFVEYEEWIAESNQKSIVAAQRLVALQRSVKKRILS